jgi:hypothetical protein
VRRDHGTEIANRVAQRAELQQMLTTNNAKLAEAQRVQAEMLRKERELEEAKREMDLMVEKKVQEDLGTVRDKARLEAEDALKAKVTEKETQIAGMQRQIEELRRKAEQGSQQLQGEALEIELESLLRNRFPRDLIEPVAKGEFGGDVMHRVLGPGGQASGTILWESKRTRNWNDAWLGKLRDDQRAAKAEVALIVSTALPKGIESFDLVDNVWVALQTRPLTDSSAPVTALAASLATKRMTSASSFGATHLAGSASGMLARFAAVSMIEGSTAFTVILPFNSAASDSVSLCTPAFDAA